jgi:hypothetical protein
MERGGSSRHRASGRPSVLCQSSTRRWAPRLPILPPDSLARWREFFAHHPHFDPPFPELTQVPLVLDASVVLGDLRWIVRHCAQSDVRSAFEEAAAAGTLVAYAPPWLREEIERKLPIVAARDEISLEALREAWTRYQTAIWFYQPSVTDPGDAVDPKDAPYRQLAEELGALPVCTKDHHLRAMGATTMGARELVLLRDFSRAASTGLALKIGGRVALMVAGAPLVALARAGARFIARLPAPVQVGLALAALWAVLHPKGRAFLAQTASSPRLQPVKRVVKGYLQELGRSQATASERWGAVKTSLPDRRRQLLIAHARAICAAAPGPLSEQAIESAIRKAGYVTRSRNFRAYLRRRLRADPRFQETDRGQWSVIRAPNGMP